jgi:hypothetical protein
MKNGCDAMPRQDFTKKMTSDYSDWRMPSQRRPNSNIMVIWYFGTDRGFSIYCPTHFTRDFTFEEPNGH